MVKILREMTAEERKAYDSFCQKHPWLAEVKMTDDELRARMDKDLGAQYLERFSERPYKDIWSWVCIGVFKHFYEHNEFAETGSNYLDGQNENVIDRILKAHGSDWSGVTVLEERERTE